MKKWLLKLSTGSVVKIANDCGYEGSDRTQAISHLVAYAKAYRVSAADFQARYNMGPNDTSGAKFVINEDKDDPWSEFSA